MTIFSYTKPLILFFLLFFSGEKLQGQTTINSKHDSLNYISYRAFFLNLQKRDSIHFFYKPEWFENKKIDSLFTRLKLEDALSHVESLCHLSYYLIDKRSIVFVPYQTSLYSSSETK
jgi:hypothetical protein